jgi:general secretion pathway protein E
LVRKTCTACQGSGCAVCGQTGYQGRSGIFELLSVDEALRGLIHNRASESDMHRQAQRNGLGSLREDGERLVAEGVTSLEEVLRVTRD